MTNRQGHPMTAPKTGPEMLPCPFCGHEAELDALEGSRYWRGMCQSSFKCGNGPWKPSRTAATEAWNTRSLPALDAVVKAKDAAYSERNKLVAALSKLFPASLERHEESDKTWENDWRWIVFINLPTGQVSWHIHDSELPNFDHLHRICGRVWDGHTTEQKYERLAALALAKGRK